MQKKDLSRRDLVRKIALTGAIAGAATGVRGADYGAPAAAAGSKFGPELIQPAQEGREKHAPDISAPEKVESGTPFEVEVTVGKEKRHPNIDIHHIKWLQVFAKESGAKPMVHVATFDMGPGYAEPKVRFPMMLKKTSTLYVLAYCNIHGVWENSVTVKV